MTWLGSRLTGLTPDAFPFLAGGAELDVRRRMRSRRVADLGVRLRRQDSPIWVEAVAKVGAEVVAGAAADS